MDPTHHSKIVDKLMQYRGKIPKDGQLSDYQAKCYAYEMRKNIDKLIFDIEWFAVLHQKELIR